ncbi:mechanosensitive ion channel [filamentous cyanobacterium LEGE 11480]|uniref:Mechanosensitive ion channel n=1 Tax=Romeriopsis navalis LEGE 11480 TaxID=2777977 RepID=A0A928VPP8_9CYAN|nr:mechanosensitive ion channel family protein [Romeriopsis navalis]MBE9029849.1 mechanosensitive ion channel [Romeriopsis navalis LEGE 11480]
MTISIIVTAIQLSTLVVIFTLIYTGISAIFKTVAASSISHKQSRAARYRRKIGIFLLLLCTVLCLAVAALNGYILYQGNSVLEIQQNWLQAVPQDFWQTLILSLAKCLLLTFLMKFALSGIHDVLKRLSKIAKNYDRIQANDESIGLFFDFLSQVTAVGASIWTVILCTQLLNFSPAIIGGAYWVLSAYLITVLGLLVVKAMPILIDTLDALSLQLLDSDDILHIYVRLGNLIPLLKRCLEFIIYIGIASIILRSTTSIAWLSQYTDRGINIIATYFFARFAIDAVTVAVDEFVKHDAGLTDIQKQQRLTIAPLLKSSLKYSVYFGLIVRILGIINIDPTPILAGAGILGLAVGFGAQNLIEDIVSGFLILFENYYLVGDYIAAGKLEERPVEGIVEAIELRTTQLRHPDGQLQIVRNGEIGSVVNYSKQYIYAKVDIPLAYATPLETVYDIIATTGAQLRDEQPDIVLETTQVDGLERFGKNLVLLRTITKVKPGKHRHVQRLLRRMLKDQFETANICLSDYEPEPKSEREL